MYRRAKRTLTPITPEWVSLIEQELNRRGWTVSRLAQELDVSHVTVGRLLRGEVRASAHVRRICDVLDLPTPTAAVAAQSRHNRLLAKMEKLNDAQRALVESLIEEMLRDK